MLTHNTDFPDLTTHTVFTVMSRLLIKTTNRHVRSSEVKVKNQQECIIKSDLRPDLVYCKTGVGSQIMVIKIIVQTRKHFLSPLLLSVDKK